MKKISVSDLSIGDWVCAEQLCGVHSEPRLTPPMKVVGLGESWVNLAIDPEQGDPFEFDPSEIRGVPIASEVLEKNGLCVVEEDADFCEYELFGSENFSIFHIKGTLHYRLETPQASVVCWNVHQLQHALRLAGVGKEIVL